LKEAVPEAQASWSRDANLHLTIKFLGEMPPILVQNLSAAASRAVEELAPFRIRFQQTGAFPRHGPPRVLWIGINDLEGKLGELYARLEDECEKKGFQKEQRPFHPHLTVARLRKPQHAQTLALAHKGLEFEPVEIIVSDLLVIRSELHSEGSKYSVISRHRLSDKP
jgi:2'-5' RNA ligase